MTKTKRPIKGDGEWRKHRNKWQKRTRTPSAPAQYLAPGRRLRFCQNHSDEEENNEA